MNSFLLFGGLESSSSLEFCLALQQRGLGVLLIDTKRNRKGIPNFLNKVVPASCVLDQFLVEPDDLPAIIQKVDEWSRDHQIVGGFNTTEEFLLNSAYVLERLRCDGPGVFASLVSSNKDLQRRLLGEYGPRMFTVEDGRPLGASYPLMIKPASAHGGAGIQVVWTEEEARAALRARSGEVVVLEEFVEGTDFSVECIMQDGQFLFENVTEEYSLPYPLSHLEMGHGTPPTTLSDDTVREAYAINRSIHTRLGFRSGISHTEYRLDKQGRVRFIEIATRPPGDSLLRLYTLSTGQPIEPHIIRSVMKEPVTYPQPTRWARQAFFVHKPGTFSGISGHPAEVKPNYYYRTQERGLPQRESLSSESRLHEIFCYFSPGERLRELKDASTRVGFYVVSAPNKQDLIQCEESWGHKLSVDLHEDPQ